MILQEQYEKETGFKATYWDQCNILQITTEYVKWLEERDKKKDEAIIDRLEEFHEWQSWTEIDEDLDKLIKDIKRKTIGGK